jgi:MoCo/4Fe-4S cofactor protein with predicted Tat translocation signal
MKNNGKALDLVSFRARLDGMEGEQYWKTLEELSEEEVFQEFLDQEFPAQTARELEGGVDRRNFLKLMGASMALAGLTACDRPPARAIVPYVQQPEEIIPGRPLYYATALPLGRSARGVLVESHMGRPTKIEGNPQHPASLGATDAMMQAEILQLYDPDRAKSVRSRGRIRTWSDFATSFDQAIGLRRGAGGEGIRILSRTVVSPTMGGQLQRILEQLPRLRWHQFDAAVADGGREGRRSALGAYRDPLFRFDQADVILSLDSDFLGSGDAHLRYARDFADRRRVRTGSSRMNRLYVAAATPSPTTSIADHHFPTRASDMEAVAGSLLAALGGGGASGGSSAGWIPAVARDLQRNAGSSIVVAGEHLSPAVHEIVHRINETLGNVGRTVLYVEPSEIRPVNQMASLRELVRDIDAGAVEVLVILDANPVYEAPGDLRFAEALAKVPLVAQMSLTYDETSEFCHWHIPATHPLENWSDARAFDGTESIVQPLIHPLYDGHSAHEILSIFTGELNATPYDTVRSYWETRAGAADFETWWRTALHDGIIRPESVAPAQLSFPPEESTADAGEPQRQAGGMEIIFRPDPAVYDGRYANNGWLQEMPKPLTKITWDNVAMVSPDTAAGLGLKNEDVVEVHYRGGSIEAPVWITPGHAHDSVTVGLGYGRTRAGRVGNGQGFDASVIRPSDAPWVGSGVELRATNRRHRLASTQKHFRMYGRNLIRGATFDRFRKDPNVTSDAHAGEGAAHQPSMYAGSWEYTGYAWGMSIDQSVCTGCGGCVIACVAENNIPVVGKKEVLNQREMHWLRIDRYYRGDANAPQTFHQPMLCQQCENAPCEPVCPVEATSHSDEGLNDMTYNRCVGTRYCSNNCPYKVRRFNFYQFQDWNTPSLKLGRNPDVTVRSRGVMEKCTYCVQRINEARIAARREDREIRDGEIVTACQQSCPTQAIVFGDINDPGSRVSKLKAEAHDYALLSELNTRPRTTYLATIRNLNPEIRQQ